MTSVTDLDLPAFDNMAADLTGDVYHQRLADVRRQGWLARSPLSVVVLDRESGEFFLRSKATAFPGREIADLFGVTGGRLREQIDANILNLTGAHHRRLRALVGPSFSPRAADSWRPVMREFLAELWSAIEPAATCEFVAAVAKPYPSLTISAVLGAPREDAPRLHEWSGWVQRQFDIRALASELARIERATTEVYDYVEALLKRRPDEPSDDLISGLLAAEAQGDRLSHSECVNLVLNVIAGGIDTTQSQLAHALRLFALHPGQWALLAQRPELAAQAVSEVLRFEPITPFTARLCVQEVEHRGVVFPAGTIVAICAERANREPAAGAAADGDQADGERFDITVSREDRLLTFGAGPHYCLGANLARAELEEALTFLAPRMPGLALDGVPELGGVDGIYGIDALPLRWTAARRPSDVTPGTPAPA
ncbi:MAG TPA: cytochrome P450 [Streptosporangiaceae bacterium]|nr:cytochrome P450 [Streptosporangiaceae bacterium]